MFSSGADPAGFVQVDELLDRTEAVHVNCELACRNVRDSLAALRSLVEPGSDADPELVYGEFLIAIEFSETQATDLRESFEPMVEVASRVFEDWETDLESFSSEQLREHSRARRAASLDRYSAIEISVEPTLAEYEAFNQELRDIALYLGNDLSSGGIAIIEKELRDLAGVGDELEENFDVCTLACQDYVRRAALRGQMSSGSKRKKGI